MSSLVSVYKSNAIPFPAGLVSSCHTSSFRLSLGLDLDIVDRKSHYI